MREAFDLPIVPPVAGALPGVAVALAVAFAPLLSPRPTAPLRHAAAAAAPSVRTVVERLSAKTPAYRAVLDVPQLVFAARPNVSDRVDAAIATWVSGQVHLFAGAVATDLAHAKGLPASLPESSLDLTFRVERLDTHVLSLRLTMESYVRGQASPAQVPAGLTFNLANGQPYSLSSLFAPHAAYLPVLARLATTALKQFRPAGARCYVGGVGPPAKASSFVAWWLHGQSLVLSYPAGQYTAAYCGPPTVTVPAAALAALLAAGGPLAA